MGAIEMNKLAKLLSDYIVKDTELEYEVIKYGVDAILSTGLCFSIALIVCTICGNFMFGILFICFLTPIKMQFTSYHCKTMTQCIFTYSICVGVILLIYEFLSKYDVHVNLLYLIVVVLFIAFCVRSELNKKTFLYLVYYFIVGIIMYFNVYSVYLVLILSLFFELFLVLINRIH